MIWIVKTTSNLGTDDAKAAAAELIEKIIEKANEDKGFHEEVEKALAGLQSLGATIQAERGQYDKAKDLIDQLIQDLSPRTGAAGLARRRFSRSGRPRIRPSMPRPSANGTRCGRSWSA